MAKKANLLGQCHVYFPECVSWPTKKCAEKRPRAMEFEGSYELGLVDVVGAFTMTGA